MSLTVGAPVVLSSRRDPAVVATPTTGPHPPAAPDAEGVSRLLRRRAASTPNEKE